LGAADEAGWFRHRRTAMIDLEIAKRWIESRLLREEAQRDAKSGLEESLQ
jgi:hypothetical protein